MCSVPAEQFASMSWVAPQLGAGALVYPGNNGRDHARAAIQLLSPDRVERHLFTHTGWCPLDDGRYVFLHAGGAVGFDGAVPNVAVEIGGMLGKYQLPNPPRSLKRLQEVIRTSEEALRGLAPAAVLVPLIGCAYRAVWGGSDYSLNLLGGTGHGKSEMAALAQQHFGAEMSRPNLPGSWSSTANSLEEAAFLAKDVILVVDDFAPKGSRYEMDKLYGVAERLLRAAGNQSGRGRMRADTTLRSVHPPRGLIVSTGEEAFRGQSLNARLLTLEIERGTLDWGQLSIAQEVAAAGVFATAMAAFIRYLAEDYPYAQRRFRQLRKRLLKEAQVAEGTHRRTPGIMADLAATWWMYLDFLDHNEVISGKEQSRRWEEIWRVLILVGARQSRQIAEADPVERFLDVLVTLFATKRAHLGVVDENDNDNCSVRPEWGSGEGDFLGYAASDGLYLEPKAAFTAVQRYLSLGGDSLGMTERTLTKRLDESNYLVSTGSSESNRESRAVRRSFEGRRISVLHLRSDALSDKRRAPLLEADRDTIKAPPRAGS